MNILVLGSKKAFLLLEKDSSNNYVLLDDYRLDAIRGCNFQKLILLNNFEDSYENLNDVYRAAFSIIRGEGADFSLLKKLKEIENKVIEFRKELLKDWVT